MSIRFGPFMLNVETRELTNDGVAVHLSPKAFDLLAALAAERPRVLSKSILLERVWPQLFVSEGNLSNLIAELRAALNDDARAPEWIRTVHGCGYAFAGATAPPLESVVAGPPLIWVEWEGRRIPLSTGDHLVGRDHRADVRLDHPSVSRRHARLIVDASGAAIADVSSKNGTFRGGTRVIDPVAVADGDAIRLGSVLIIIHMMAGAVTATVDGPAS
jgi:hypothetical protein